jgi:mannose/fructose/N-acetylgalactosamine-specific phosphotransferase system component IID
MKKIFSIMRKVPKAIKFETIYLNLLRGLTIISVILGTVVSALGFYGLATGSGVTFVIGTEKPLTVNPTLAGLLTTLLGIILTFEGIYLVKAHFETSKIIFICILFGYLTLNIPALLLGLGYSLFAGIFAVVFGYLWVVTVILWLQRGE